MIFRFSTSFFYSSQKPLPNVTPGQGLSSPGCVLSSLLCFWKPGQLRVSTVWGKGGGRPWGSQGLLRTVSESLPVRTLSVHAAREAVTRHRPGLTQPTFPTHRLEADVQGQDGGKGGSWRDSPGLLSPGLSSAEGRDLSSSHVRAPIPSRDPTLTASPNLDRPPKAPS